MKIHKLENFTKGWFIGNFEPTILNTEDFEVGIKYYKKGDFEKSHVHKVATEYTVIVSGIVKMNGQMYIDRDIIEIQPGDHTDFEALCDTITLVVKIPSIKGDKYDTDIT